MRGQDDGGNADRRLPVFLGVSGLSYDIEAQARRLLRMVFLRDGAMPPGPIG